MATGRCLFLCCGAVRSGWSGQRTRQANLRGRFAGSDCRRAQARRQGAIHAPDADKSGRACLGWRGNAPATGRQARSDLTRVKSDKKELPSQRCMK